MKPRTRIRVEFEPWSKQQIWTSSEYHINWRFLTASWIHSLLLPEPCLVTVQLHTASSIRSGKRCVLIVRELAQPPSSSSPTMIPV